MQPRPASTLALLRDSAQGPEVLMLQRTHRAVFMPGHYVFPGGAVDDADQGVALADLIRGHDDVSASALLGLERGGLGYLVAAVRECFEEAGVLLAQDRAGNDVPPDHPVLGVDREAVAHGRLSLDSLYREHDLVLPLDRIAYLDHWITPLGPPRRFDTRFFVAAAPRTQTPVHDGQETIDHCWLRPAMALEDHRARRRQFATPTLAVLRRLAGFTSVEHALADHG